MPCLLFFFYKCYIIGWKRSLGVIKHNFNFIELVALFKNHPEHKLNFSVIIHAASYFTDHLNTVYQFHFYILCFFIISLCKQVFFVIFPLCTM